MQNITDEQFKNFKALLYLKRPYLNEESDYSIAQQLAFSIAEYLVENGFKCINDNTICFKAGTYEKKKAFILRKDKYSFTLVTEDGNDNRSPSWYINVFESGRVSLCNTSFILYLFDEKLTGL